MIDALMALAIIIALVVNSVRKHRLRVGDPDEPVTREYLEVNVSFYRDDTAGALVLLELDILALPRKRTGDRRAHTPRMVGVD